MIESTEVGVVKHDDLFEEHDEKPHNQHSDECMGIENTHEIYNSLGVEDSSVEGIAQSSNHALEEPEVSQEMTENVPDFDLLDDIMTEPDTVEQSSWSESSPAPFTNTSHLPSPQFPDSGLLTQAHVGHSDLRSKRCADMLELLPSEVEKSAEGKKQRLDVDEDEDARLGDDDDEAESDDTCLSENEQKRRMRAVKSKQHRSDHERIPGTSRSAVAERKRRHAVKDGAFKIDKAKMRKWQTTIHDIEPHAQFLGDSVVQVRHPLCGKVVKVKNPYDTSRFRSHCAKCKGPPQKSRQAKQASLTNAGSFTLDTFFTAKPAVASSCASAATKP